MRPQKYLTKQMLEYRFEEPTPLRFPNLAMYMPWGGDSIWWQDSAGTTPAKANADPVYQVIDFSDRRFNLGATDNARRPAVSAGGYYSSLSFDTTKRIEGNANSSLFVGEQWSIAVWVRPAATTAGLIIGRFINTGTSLRWMLQVESTSSTFRFRTSPNGTSASAVNLDWSSSAITPGNWYLVNISHDTINTWMNVNNNFVAVSESTSILNTTGIVFTAGARWNGVADPTVNFGYNGSIGEIVGISGRAYFTSDEVQIMMNRRPPS